MFSNLLRERERYIVAAVPMCNFINSLFRINLAMLAKICDTLWFEGDLKNIIDDSVEFVRTLLQNVFTSAVWS